MPTRSALVFLFAILIAVPVGAAVYLGSVGVERERAVAIAREGDSLHRLADDTRDRFVRQLQLLYRQELERSFLDYAGTLRFEAKQDRSAGPLMVRRSMLERNNPRAPLHDYFQIWPNGTVSVPTGGEAPTDIVAFAQSTAPQLLKGGGPPEAREVRWTVVPDDVRAFVAGGAIDQLRRVDGEAIAYGTGWRFAGDLATRLVDIQGDHRVLQGFRLDVDRLAQKYLDPASPDSILPNDERLEDVRLVLDDPRLRTRAVDALGLEQVLYRNVVAAGRGDEPPLLPPGHALEISVHPAPALAAQLTAAGERLTWTLGAVGVVLALGLLFAWRAVRAETRLATRKSEFVSSVSHELRTPLTSIRMYADMLKEGWVDDEKTRTEYFSLISAESERLARLVNNVLDFSRIEKGQKAFEMRVGDPAPVVRDVVEVLRPYLREKGFKLSLDIPKKLPECSFDKDALTQILVNLIDNAVKYGEKEVRVEAERQDGSIVLKVSDRGPGVPADERERIFEAFHRGPNASTAGGSGLGLALVRHYAAAHQGRIDIADRDGGGAVFALTLPAA